jgi:hypothetical protein
MSEEKSFSKPRWLRDLLRFLPLRSQFVLSGNIRNLHPTVPAPGVIAAVPLTTALSSELHQSGYPHVLIYEPFPGFCVATAPGNEASQDETLLNQLNQLNITPSNNDASSGMDLLGSMLERFVNFDGPPAALIVDFASRLLLGHDTLTPKAQEIFSRALILSHKARARPYGPKHQPFFNTLLWIIDKEGDLPDWLLIENPRIRHIPVPKPDPSARRTMAQSLLRTLPGGREGSLEDMKKAEQSFIDETEGLLLSDLSAITQLGRGEAVPISKISDAVRRYKVGVTEDPWRKIARTKIHTAAEFIHLRVKGQEHAITHMLDNLLIRQHMRVSV